MTTRERPLVGVSLRGVRCLKCGLVMYPCQAFGCVRCGSHGETLEEHALTGSGTARAAVTVYPTGLSAAEKLWTALTVELDEGPVVFGALADDSPEPARGSRVQATRAHDAPSDPARFTIVQ